MWERHKILFHTSAFVGTCFFCSKFQNDHHKIEEEKTESGNFFQSILRYLQVDLWKFYPQILAERRRIEGKQEVKIKVCESCQGILKEFGEIYVVFEEIVLHLNAYISKFHEVMKCQRDCNAKEPDDDNDNELDTLREEIILKCEEKVRHALPRVRLERLRNLKRKFPSSPSPPPTPTSDLPDQVKVESTELDMSEEADDSDLPQESKSSSPFLNRSKQKIRCALPRVRLGRLRNLKRKFPSSPSPSSSPSELPDQIEVESTKLELTENADDVSEDIENPLSPSAPPSEQATESDPIRCPEEDQLQARVDDEEAEGTLQLQFIDSETSPHPPSSSSPLASTTEEPTPEVESVSNEEESVNAGEGQLLCKHCGKAFQGQQKVQRLKHHLVIHHQDGFFPDVRKENVTRAEFINMISHVLLMSIKNDNCSLCPTVYKMKNRSIQLLFVKTHLLHKHRKTLEAALVKVQDNPELLKTSFEIELMEDDEDDQEDKPISECLNAGGRQLLCQHCGRIFQGSHRSKKLRLHLVIHHKDEFFSNLRKENVTRAEFLKMINHVLLLCIKKHNCALCPTEYKMKNRSIQLLFVKTHLLHEHRKTVEEALVKVQDNPNLLKTSFEIDLIKDDEGDQEDKPINESLNDEGCQLLCQHCGRLFPGPSRLEKLKRHLVIYHRDEFFPNLRKENVTRDEFLEMIDQLLLMCIEKDNCALCPTVYKIKRTSLQLLYVKTHLLDKHQRTLEKALVKVQDNPGMLKTSFQIEEDEGDKPTNKSINAGERKIFCQHCGKAFQGEDKTKNRKRHLFLHHKDEFFPNIRKENVTRFEFKKMIDHVLLTYIRERNCSLCSTRYKFKDKSIQLCHAKMHLLHNHRSTLEEALVKVQDNPDLLKTSSKTKENEDDKAS